MKYALFFFTIVIWGCSTKTSKSPDSPYMMVLGIAQDAGYPQMNCKKDCCKLAWKQAKLRRMTSCLAIVDPQTKQQWIIDATPDIKDQLQILKNTTGTETIDGVLLTHAHIGHYSGLIHFGREAMGAQNIPVYAMPKMKSFLEENGPWSQLVSLKNISIETLKADSTIRLNTSIEVKPFLVPHRDEFSETVGYEITLQNKTLLFIPDIDKWSKWNTDIKQLIKRVDYAFLDGTFYMNGELERDMSEVPHPFVEESMANFSELSASDKPKVHFIHFNHTNPLLIDGNEMQQAVIRNGYHIAKEGQIIQF